MKPKLTTPQLELLMDIYRKDRFVVDYYAPLKKLLSMKLVEPFPSIKDWYRITELGRETLKGLD